MYGAIWKCEFQDCGHQDTPYSYTRGWFTVSAERPVNWLREQQTSDKNQLVLEVQKIQ